MKRNEAWLLSFDGNTCQAAVLRDDQVTRSERVSIDAELGVTAENVRDALKQLGHSEQPIVVGLGSTWCISGSLPLPQAKRARRRNAIGFLFEPQSPWPVEEAVVDYETSGKRVLLFAAEATRLQWVVDAVRATDTSIVAIMPTSRLAMADQLNLRREQPTVLLSFQECSIEAWVMTANGPRDWLWLPRDMTAVHQSLLWLDQELAGIANVIAFNASDDDYAACVQSLAQWPVERGVSIDTLEAATRTTLPIIQGRLEPPVDLHREPLQLVSRRNPLAWSWRALQASCLLLIAVWGAILWHHTQVAEAQRARNEECQRSTFMKLFPDQKVPIAIRSRLQSEVSRLKGLSGQAAEAPTDPTILPLFRQVLACLPDGMRLRILEVRFDRGQVSLIGRVRAHSDADRIATELRNTGLEVSSPTTSRLETEGIEFRIAAKVPTPRIAVRTEERHQ